MFASMVAAAGVIAFALLFFPNTGIKSWVGTGFISCCGLSIFFAAIDALIGNEVMGDFWTASRTKNPLSFWFSVVVMFGFAVILFLLAYYIHTGSVQTPD